MKTHFDNLLLVIPDFLKREILDLGSGRGKFIVDAKKHGVSIKGIELSQSYIDETMARAKEANVDVSVVQGVGENIPFLDNSFDFVNMSEVIEHVNDPIKVMKEVYRVLRSGGMAYVSVPSRFSIKDPHFHLYFVNWIPRSFCYTFISIFGKHKDYNGDTGYQRLEDLHYYTKRNANKLFKDIGFEVDDNRATKIKKFFRNRFISAAVLFLYSIGSPFYFDTFHFVLRKK